MSRGKKLTEKEKGKIEEMLDEEKTITFMARKIGKSRTCVRIYINLLKGKSPAMTPKKVGRKGSLGPKTKKKIIDLVRNKPKTANQIKSRLGLTCSKRTVLRVINSSKYLKRRKMKRIPKLTRMHRYNRYEFSMELIKLTKQWRHVIFSDEKKFNLDGPDGYRYYWHDINSEELTFSKRVQGEGGLMVWVGVSYYGKTTIMFLDKKVNAEVYVKMLETVLPDYIDEIFKNRQCIFQQDNAPCHKAKKTIKWFEDNKINLMEWPALSPDLNPVENIWGMMSRKIYENGKQYDNLRDLKTAILCAWSSITDEDLKSLVESMPMRMEQVVRANGNIIKY